MNPEDETPFSPQDQREVDAYLAGYDAGERAGVRRRRQADAADDRVFGPDRLPFDAALKAALDQEFQAGVAIGAALHRYYQERVEAEGSGA